MSDTSRFRLGPFELSFVAVSHSVPDALSVVVGTDIGAIIITGDYKFDHTPIDGRITDVNTFAQLGQQGVLALLADSTNAETPGSTASEWIVGQAFHQIFAEAEGRVIVACFASHIHRVQQAIEIAHLHGRKFALSGRSMQKNVNIARNLGILNVPEGALIKLTEIDQYRPEEILDHVHGEPGRAALGAHAHGVRRSPAGRAARRRHRRHLRPPDPRQRGQRHDHGQPPAQGRAPRSSTGATAASTSPGTPPRKTCA